MSFAAPLALIALLLVPLVVLLHTIAARWRDRDVSSLAHWEETLRGMRTSLRIRRLLRSLALLAAVLAVASLVVGLARPLLRRPPGEAAGDTVLVLDVSASMAARSGGATRFDEAREEALRLVAGLRRDARLCVIAAGGTPRVLAPFTDDRDALRRAIAGASVTDEAGAPAAGLLFALGLRERRCTARVVFVTDGAFTGLGDADPGRTGVRVITVGGPVENAGITAMSFRRTAAGGVELFVSIAASGGMSRVVPLVVSAGSRTVVRREVTIGEAGTASVSVPWEGPTAGRVAARIEVDDGLAADDAAYAVFAPARRMRVLLAGEPDAFLEAALGGFPGVVLKRVDAVDPVGGARELEGYDLAVFNGGEPPAVERGNVLVFAAVPQGLPLEPRATVVGPRFVSWDRDHPLLASLALGPVVIERALAAAAGPGVQVIARSREAPLLATWEREGLRVLFVAFRPSQSDLPLRAAFPLLVANALAWFRPGVLGADATSYRTGATVEVGVPGDAREARVTGPDGREATWPVTSGVLAYTGTSRAGFHRVQAAGFAQDVAVSLCDASETDLSPRVAASTGDAGDGTASGAGSGAGGDAAVDRPAESPQRQPAWFAFALAGFLLVVAEGLLWAVQKPASAGASPLLEAVQRPPGAAATRSARRGSAAGARS